jgi:hypothetical protein
MNQLDRKIKSDVDNFLAAGGRITCLPAPGYYPYPESTRKPLPEWEARKAQREKERQRALAPKPDEYTQPEVMKMFGCPKSPEGYKKFDRMLNLYEVPPADRTQSKGGTKVTRWWKRDRIDAILTKNN